MEQPPNLENPSEGSSERILSLEEKLALVEALFKANENRNRFVEGHGGNFDTFAESWANLPEVREKYDELEKLASDARKKLDETIYDKEAFVEELNNAGREDYANRIASIFGVSKGSFVSRIRKKLSK